MIRLGIDEGKRWESFRAMTYMDKGVLAIGFGHTNRLGTPPVVTAGMVIDYSQACQIYEQDLEHIWTLISKGITVPIGDQMAAAVTLVASNIGPNAFLKSSILSAINSNDFKSAALAFGKWSKTRDNTGALISSDGLTLRRWAEATLFYRDVVK